MSSKVKYAIVGLLTILMLVYMTGYAGSIEAPAGARTGEQRTGSDNTEADNPTEESQAPDSVLVGINILEIVESQLEAEQKEERAEESAPEADSTPADGEEVSETLPGEIEEELIPSAYDGIAVVTINEAYLRVRADASTDAATIGRMYPQSKGTIIESKNGWYHISSGNVDGWISSDFAVTGRAADEFVKANFDAVVTIATEVLRVRQEADVDATFMGYVKMGQSYPVLGEENGWYLVEFTPGKTGYISGKYVTIGASLANAMTLEEVKAYERQQELEAKAEKHGASLRSKTSATEEQVYLLAALCRHEAGEKSYEGALAVANVVINRMRNGYWGRGMEDVIYAPGQFQYVNDGALNKFLANPPAICLEAARDALDGLNNIGDYLFFRSAKTADVSQFSVWVNVGGNIFYKK
ncbi:MAG: SH3 domain-containing protein [Lachnospiraceae bacterium]|nr:SH3 domain-containing protein [Lachnospiraceae bacterium]